ncbi:MAG: hypothetical protein H7336_00400 [Bacteriovorax sp.]|nr:hypothetical protein [Bacteriovorax sp.]
MRIPPFKTIIPEQVKPYKDRFRALHDRSISHIKKEHRIEKRYIVVDLQEKNIKIIHEEKIQLKINNEKWKQLNIIT